MVSVAMRTVQSVTELDNRHIFTVTARSVTARLHVCVCCLHISTCPSVHLPVTLYRGLLKTSLLTVGSDPGVSIMVTRKDAWLWGSEERVGVL